MTPEQALTIGVHLAQGVIAAHNGDHVGAASHALDAVLEAIPAEEARKLLDEAAIRRANAVANAIEDARFGKEPG